MFSVWGRLTLFGSVLVWGRSKLYRGPDRSQNGTRLRHFFVDALMSVIIRPLCTVALSIPLPTRPMRQLNHVWTGAGTLTDENKQKRQNLAALALPVSQSSRISSVGYRSLIQFS
ncbi:hypothetical protein EDB92DRAFT_1316255 [Lactarius akahatsu]|uniref:Uncharacterized protein n=1 Tax=Lactarius akahatsu TaxID=416441 RepID=A0AAD4LMW6_9AGAM|nr:hypothetical protein EDB92DRAFT_1316255 [Lactarius akahatsu]